MVTDSQRHPMPEKWHKSAVMTDRWRLINGRELYDIKKDKGQHKDISSDHPQVIEQLRKDYDKWWDIVSKQYDNMIPFILARCPL